MSLNEAMFENLTKELRVAPNKYSNTPEQLTKRNLWDTSTFEEKYPERFPGHLYQMWGDRMVEVEWENDHLFSSRPRVKKKAKSEPPSSAGQQIDLFK